MGVSFGRGPRITKLAYLVSAAKLQFAPRRSYAVTFVNIGEIGSSLGKLFKNLFYEEKRA